MNNSMRASTTKSGFPPSRLFLKAYCDDNFTVTAQTNNPPDFFLRY
jgi:hypothetical protein